MLNLDLYILTACRAPICPSFTMLVGLEGFWRPIIFISRLRNLLRMSSTCNTDQCLGFLVHNANATPRYCYTKELFLFSDFLCTLDGLSRLSSTIYSPLETKVSSSNLGRALDTTPWSYRSTCSAQLDSPGSELCVYTNRDFDGGKGLSIIATPSTAEHFASRGWLQESSQPSRTNLSSQAIQRVATRQDDVSGVAAKAIQPGELIATDTPMLIMPLKPDISHQEWEELLRVAFLQLPLASQAYVSRLKAGPGDDDLFLSRLVDTNAGYFIAREERMYYGLYRDTTMLNHHCAPK